MATNNCEIYSAIRRPLDAFVKYFLDIKPYHTKLLEVLEIYNFYDTINVKIDENITKNITFLNKPLCNPTGWGVDWDDQCGFDAISCCDLFDCIGGFGLIYNNSDLLVSANVVSTTTDGTITLNGNYTYDVKIPIKSIQNAEQFTVAGDQRIYFNTFNIFLVIPRHIYSITTVNNNGFIVTGDITSEITERRTFIVYGSNGNDGTYIVNTASYDPSTNLTTIVVVEHINHIGGNGFIQVNSSNKNNGVYQVLGTPAFNGVDTVVTINGDAKRFTILNEITHGSVQFRSGLIYPRHITLSGNSSHNDGDYKILSSLYDYTTNKTTLTLSGILPDISNTGTVNLYGYEFEAGFEAGPECSIPKPSDIHMVFSERLTINVISIPKPTPSVTPTITPTVTPTITPTVTPSSTMTPTPTVTPTITPTVTPSSTMTPTPTQTITPTVTPSAVSIIPLTFNVTNAYGYQIFACGASNNAAIDWGDGNIDIIPDGAPDGSDNACSNGISHTYAVAGNYTIKIYGNYIANIGNTNFAGIYMNLLPADPGGSSSSLVTWGNGNISNINFSPDIISVPNYLPSTLIYANGMFLGATAFNQDLNTWNTSNLTSMNGMFNGAINFNQNISGWNTSNVTDMNSMFSGATAFNQDLNTWNTSNVTNMSYMFSEATAFNGNISSWDTSNVTDMSLMFGSYNLISPSGVFNQDISGWNTSKVTNMSLMFASNTAFNQNISSWDTSNVTDMSAMFNHATAFNQNLNTWNTIKATNMSYMFQGALAFNGNISSWNTSNVTNMSGMFSVATAFNQNLSGWCVTNIPSLPANFDTGASAWSLPRPVWGTCP